MTQVIEIVWLVLMVGFLLGLIVLVVWKRLDP